MTSEFIATTEKINKKGQKYYTQVFTKMNVDNEGNFTEEITWQGRARKTDYEWCLEISKTQPERFVSNDYGTLIITN
jgi:alpha-acetolactate decarboxylase